VPIFADRGRYVIQISDLKGLEPGANDPSVDIFIFRL
jgi:hypothetical protein